MTAVVYNSFNGRYSDNPRAIYEELARRGAGCEHLWTAKGETPDRFPPGARAIVPGTPDHRRRVDAAKYIVANVEMREHLRKTSDMVFVQTWHGTALKRIGYDNRYVHAHPAAFERDVEEYRRWDYLISPNAFTSEIMRSAFRGFEGEILETGYPRNDVLNSPGRAATRARVRKTLGIEPGQRAVLYAPTWRDNLYHEQGPGAFQLALDVDEMARRLGDDHVLMLRLHFLVAEEAAGARGDAVRDVSQYEDIRDLYLAADVLITDYSSVMFDFAITGKPLLFYTYDLAHYRDELRGFYFDLEAEAPGPLCGDMDELIEALADRRGTRAAFADRYAAFRQRYCYLDDGRAAERVVDRVFGELGSSGRVAADDANRDVGRVRDDGVHA